MPRRLVPYGTGSLILTTVVVLSHLSGGSLLAAPPVVDAGTLEELASDAEQASEVPIHSHKPYRVNSRPIVERVLPGLVRPRHLAFDADGNCYVADQAAGIVLRRGPDGLTETLLEGLHEPVALLVDHPRTLYVCCRAEGLPGEGAVLRFREASSMTDSLSMSEDAPEAELVAAGLTGPSALALDADGTLLVACQEEHRILKLSPGGEPTTLAEGVPHPSCLAVAADGSLFIISASEGTLVRIDPMGDTQILARDLASASAMTLDEHGNLIVCSYGTRELLYIGRDGGTKPYATVPAGTIAHELDADGNIWLANWDYRFVMKVTRNMSIPCPHCGRPIPLWFRPRDEGDSPAAPKSETPTNPPSVSQSL